MLISTKMNGEKNIEYFVEVGYVNRAPCPIKDFHSSEKVLFVNTMI